MFTFLFTDITDSTPLWQRHPQAMSTAQADHDALIESQISQHAGRIVKLTGDGVHAVFEATGQAIQAAIGIQQSLQTKRWESVGELKVRIGMHTGEAEPRGDDYYGIAVNKAARIMGMASGKQILLSGTTHALLRETPLGSDESIRYESLGQYRLKGLQGRTEIYQIAHPDLPARFPPLRGSQDTPHNLPVRSTAFVGRDSEIDHIGHLLADTDQDPERKRLVTLIGPGGTGKTRLSIRVARDLLEAFPDGIWLVELAPLADPAAIPQALIQVLNLQENRDVPAQKMIVNYLRERQTLLIFDNCEHVIEETALLVDVLLQSAPLVQVMASSREALGIAGESILRIPSLPIPSDDGDWTSILESEAVQLLRARAEAADCGHWIIPEHGPAIAEICRRLDGIPLAIEMAAARLRVFSPDQILERLDDRFRLLTGGSRTALPRLQTLKALIDWSYDLLSEEEQGLMQDLSVFSGGWTIEMAMAVCSEGDVIELIPALVEKSLVVAEPDDMGMRYRYLETVRQYARDRLMEAKRSAHVRGAHLAYFVDYTAGDLSMDYAGLQASFVRMRREIDNIRAALAWGLEQDAWSALEIASHGLLFWGDMGLNQEGLDWVQRAASQIASQSSKGAEQVLPPAEQVRRKRVQAWSSLAQASLLLTLGRNEAGKDLASESLEHFRQMEDRPGVRSVLYTLGVINLNTGSFDEAAAAFDEGLALGKALAHPLLDAFYLNAQGLLKLYAAFDFDAARQLMEAGLETDASIQMSAIGLLPLITLETYTGRFDRARELVALGLAAFLEQQLPGGSRYYAVYHALNGHIERKADNLDAALRLYAVSMDEFRALGMEAAMAHLTECFAIIAVEQGRLLRAARLFGAAEALRERVGADMNQLERMDYETSVGQLRQQLDSEALESAWQAGRAMGVDQARQLALEYAAR